ncbi:hypothetical protein [Lyngbya sp. CCY1209]|uniref:hypothetical protein n=1 Tax=Lyngbya sp. CCY1209 TaxID=2886103 RepID=UPI002D208485|nr:hypothetical protein [Lyngbya sp. CCY1209]MEB3885518.1 hypothetical protein [Lyngbya sp. CCY1209]
MTINTDTLSAHYRAASADIINKRLLITNFHNTHQEQDFTEPSNCHGFGRIRHFQRRSGNLFPPNPLPIDPACKALGLPKVDMIRAQVFQNAACNWRCWYCYVPFELLAANPKYSDWISPSQLIDLYLDQPDPPPIIHFLKTLPSVDPIFTFKALQKLGKSSATAQNLLNRIVNPTRREFGQPPYSDYQTGLPLPHPLDFDWRFTDATADYILKISEKFTAPNETVALLGTPSLFRAGTRTTYRRQMILLEANLTMTNYLTLETSGFQVILCNLLKDDLPDLCASFVMLDPPWYPEHIKSFLWAASQLCCLNGYILVCLPPVGTRPGIEREWESTVAWAEYLGLQLVQLEKLALSYLTPVFERNVFRAAGLPSVGESWRHGNLAIFSRTRLTNVSRPNIDIRDHDWLEVNLLGVKIRVRPCQQTEFVDPRLQSVVPNDILTSVSRRDPHRKLADVWTSGNRIFGCSGRSILWQILEAISNGFSPYEAVKVFLGRSLALQEVKLISETTEQILTLISTEQKENLLFADCWNDSNFALAPD